MEQKKLTPTVLILFAAIMILGTILLFVQITLDSLWYDESYTASIVNQPAIDIINISGGDSHPPLYYLMLRPIRLLFGNSALVLRAFSVLGALALALLGMGPVRRALGDRAGLVFSLLVFVTPITVAMAHEARMYTWAAFFVTGSALYGYLAQKDGKRADWALFVLFSLAAAYTHYYALLAVAMICAILFFFCIGDKKKRVWFFLCAGILVAAYAPWLVFKLAAQMSKVSGNYWIPPVTKEIIWSVLAYPFSLKFPDTQNLGWAIPALLVATAWIAYGIIRKIKEPETKMTILAVGAFALTILAGIVASKLIRPVLVERYMVPVLGLFLLGVAYGLSANKRRAAAAVAVSVLVLLCVPQIKTCLTTRVNGPMREVQAAMKMQVQPGDVFLHVDEHTLGTFCYYFPEQKHYYYQRKGCEGFSNYDAFAPNGITIDSLDEIGGDPRVWLVQREFGTDRYSAPAWLSSGSLVREQPLKRYAVPGSWYAVSVMQVKKGNPDTPKAATAAAPSGSGTLTVNVSSIKSDKGSVFVLLYKSEPMAQEYDLEASGTIFGGKSQVTFADLAYGEYGLIAFHDENANGSLDMDGEIPTEGIGYSNAAAIEGPPVFAVCKFRFDGDTPPQNIAVHYPR